MSVALRLICFSAGFLSYHSIDTAFILGSLLLALLLLLYRLLPNLLPGFISSGFISTEAMLLEAKTVRPQEKGVGEEAAAGARDGQVVYKRTGTNTSRREDNLRTL